MSISIKVDTSEFDKTFKEYMKVTSRTLVEAVNQHAYYIARASCANTRASNKEKIATDLNAASKKFPGAPIAAILANKQRRDKGFKGFHGARMRSAVEAFIRKRQSHRKFLASGWIPAIKQLASVVPKKGGAKLPEGAQRKGRENPKFGGSKAAPKSLTNWSPMASIWNSISGKGQGTAKVNQIITDGAQQGIHHETASMREYIQRKMDEASQRLWS